MPSTTAGKWQVVVSNEDSVTRRLDAPGGWIYRIDRITPENVAGNEKAMVGRFAGFKTIFVPKPKQGTAQSGARWELVITNEDSVTRRLEVPGGWIYRTDRIAPESVNGNEKIVVGRFAGFDADFVPVMDPV